MNLAQPQDIVLVLSVSGSSPNLIKAVEWSLQNNIYSIAFVGNKKGKLAEIANMALVTDDDHYGRVEDAHMSICHIIAYAFMELPSLQNP
jgi:D-sedoheptulose 7-phosphate isomerase